MSRLNIITKKSLALTLLLLGMVAVVTGFIYIAFKDTSVSQTLGKESAHIRYVLVNEDEGTDFEQTRYQLGQDFVTLISQDDTNQWETISRSIAETGIEKGQYDAMVVIPRDFSERVLSLQSANPEKANIEYLVRDGQSQVTNQIIEKKVNEVLYDFNTRVVQMYFSSIVGSLSDAQQNVTNMVAAEAIRNNYLISRIQTPFQNLPDSFTNALSAASILKSSSDAVQAEQEGFVSSVRSLMNGNAEELGSLADSFSPSAPPEFRSDLGQGDWRQTFGQQLDLLGSSGSQSSLYDRFLTDAKAYEEAQGQVKTLLESAIQTLEEQKTSLQGLRNTIAASYYGDTSLTPETATLKQTKEALAKLMSPQLKSNLDEAYLKGIQAKLEAVPAADLAKLVEQLAENGSLTEEQARQYRSKLAIVNRYAKDFEAETGSTAAYSFQEAGETSGPAAYSTTVTLKVATAGDTIRLSGDGLNLANGPAAAAQMQAPLNDQLTAYKQTASVSYAANSFTISFAAVSGAEAEPAAQGHSATEASETEAGETEAGEAPGEQGEGSRQTSPAQASAAAKLPDALPVTFSAELTWTPGQTGRQAYQETAYQWSNHQGNLVSGKLAAFDSSQTISQQNLSRILTNFTSLEQAAQEILTIFANPSETAGAFAARLSADDRPLSALASQNSVYYLYNNMEISQRAESISDDFAQSYKANGDSLYQEANQQLTQLQAVLGSKDYGANAGTFYGYLEAVPEPAAYYQLVLELGDWYQETQDMLDTYSGSDTSSDDSSAADTRLEDLANQLRSMQTSAREMASGTAAAASSLQSTATTVEDFTARTSAIQTSTNALLKDINQSVKDAASDLSENQDYAAAFNRVLANTKNGGADNTRVFNFLSSPIEVSSIQGSMVKTSVVPYYMTVVGALIIGVTSFFTVNLMQRRRTAAGDSLVTPSRVWSNLPNLIKIVSLVFVTALAFASATTALIQDIPKPVWFVYSFFYVFALTALFICSLRGLKRTATLYIFAGLLGIYLLLMPIIGATTKPGTVLSVIYRLSPFQNIENGYTAMINGLSVGAGSLLVLAGLAVFALCLNLFIKPEPDQPGQS